MHWLIILRNFLIFFGLFGSMQAQVFLTREQALEKVFAEADTVIRRTLFLDAAQRKSLEKLARSPIRSRIVSYYTGLRGGETLGYAFLEQQRIRTKDGVFLVLITPEGKVGTVEVLAFREPRDYLPAPGWFGLFLGRILDDRLWPGRDIHAITGATLTVRAFTQSVRRALAFFTLVAEKQG